MKHPHRERSGFTLLELIIVLAVISLAVGVTVPVASTMIRRQAREAAGDELTLLGEAAKEHFFDTGALPTGQDDLLSSSLDGWAGPYLPGVLDDRRTGLSGYQVDPWSQDYLWAVDGDVLTIASPGADGEEDTEDDIVLAIDVTPIRRALTVDRIARLQILIDQYNAYYLTADPKTSQPLPANFTQIVAMLTAAGLLPIGTDLEEDGWGDAFVPVPSVSPVLSVTSIHLEGGGSGSSGGSGGSGSSGNSGKKGNNGNAYGKNK